MKTLIFLDYFTPAYKAGGPIRIFESLARNAKPGQVSIVTRNHDWGDATPLAGVTADAWMLFENAQVLYCSPEKSSIAHLRKLIHDFAPDAIHVNSFFSRVWTNRILLLRRLGLLPQTRIFLSPHGELASSALALKGGRKRILAACAKSAGLYRGLEWIATADKEIEEIQSLFGKNIRTHLIPPPSPPVYPHLASTKKSGRLSLVFLARLSAMKNLGFMMEVLRGARGQVDFDIYGPLDPSYASEWTRVQAEFAQLSPNVRVSYRGPIASSLSAETLARYDLFVQPSLSENFGFSILEALASGTPVLISDQTPWNAVNENGAGRALALTSIEAWRATLNEFVELDAHSWRAHSERAQKMVTTRRAAAETMLQVYSR